MIHIFSPYNAPRLQYVFRTIFTHWLKVPVTIHTDEAGFLATGDKFKLYYTPNAPGETDIPWIYNTGFLEESDFRKCKVNVRGEGRDVKLFPGKGDLGFDLPSAVFYCLSRYEEYNDITRDEHGRFPAKKSLAYQLGFLQYPMVDIWRQQLCEYLAGCWGKNIFEKPLFSCIATVDVDNATAFAHKGFIRSLGGIIRAVFSFDKVMLHRIKTLFNPQNDPYKTYRKQWDISGLHGVRYIHFVLCATLSPHDRSLDPDNAAFRHILQSMYQNAEVGWHPSYSAFGNDQALEKEKSVLENIIGSSINISRQHYIRLRMPDTYRSLIQMGITEDFSMGYPENDGFRASASLPFYFFDVENNKETGLLIHTFPFLDTYYSEKKKYSAEKALKEMKVYVDRIKAAGGELVLVWHNRTFSEFEKQWKGWTDVFEKLLKYAKS
jgi:hypothetical protein